MSWAAELKELRAMIGEIDAREKHAMVLRNRLPHATNDALCVMIEAEERQALAMRELLRDRVICAEAAIASVSNQIGRSVLSMRYLLGMSWDRVAANLGYERTTIWRIHKRALAELDALTNGGMLSTMQGRDLAG